MGRKGPLNYRYLDDDGCLDREDPWPVRKTTRHPGPLVRVICGSMNLAKITDVVQEIALPKPACMKSKHGRDHIVSLWGFLYTWGLALLKGQPLNIKVRLLLSGIRDWQAAVFNVWALCKPCRRLLVCPCDCSESANWTWASSGHKCEKSFCPVCPELSMSARCETRAAREVKTWNEWW